MELQEAILKRRSIRKFAPDSVSKEDVQDIIEAGMNAPSGCNSQCWKFVAVTDKELINKVADTVTEATVKFYSSANATQLN